MDKVKRVCTQCGKEFWIIKQEQEFLQKMGLPLPTKCPTCRQARRLEERGGRQLYRTTCQQCGKKIVVTFDPEKETRKILCRQCYRDYFEKNSVLIEKDEV